MATGELSAVRFHVNLAHYSLSRLTTSPLPPSTSTALRNLNHPAAVCVHRWYCPYTTPLVCSPAATSLPPLLASGREISSAPPETLQSVTRLCAPTTPDRIPDFPHHSDYYSLTPAHLATWRTDPDDHGALDTSLADTVRSVALPTAVHPCLPAPTFGSPPFHHISNACALCSSTVFARVAAAHCTLLLLACTTTMTETDGLTLCIVGGNAVSAFLSWRLSATNACDVTLVWKSGFENVSQYGISFR